MNTQAANRISPEAGNGSSAVATQQSSVKKASSGVCARRPSAHAPTKGATMPATSSAAAEVMPHSAAASGRPAAMSAVKCSANSTDGTTAA